MDIRVVAVVAAVAGAYYGAVEAAHGVKYVAKKSEHAVVHVVKHIPKPHGIK